MTEEDKIAHNRRFDDTHNVWYARQERHEEHWVIIWVLIAIGCIILSSVSYGTYRMGYTNGIKATRTEDISELLALKTVMENYKSSIVIIDCKQQKAIGFKARKNKKIGNARVTDSVYFTGECK